jgi:hypothetical protein
VKVPVPPAHHPRSSAERVVPIVLPFTNKIKENSTIEADID